MDEFSKFVGNKIKTERRVEKINKLDAIFGFNLLLSSFFGKGRPPSSAGECPGT